MSPLKLTMVAFGPFSGVEVIDFTELGEYPLFLINGPTGAGKTSILDAMCFALYGQTTGNEREASQMRCDSSAEDLLTEIIFEFAIAGNHYRIRRVPKQVCKKSSTAKATEQKPEAQIYQIFNETGTSNKEEKLIVDKKVREATAEIIRITGLSAEQFRQVMVLPQGKFRELLTANSSERESIFSKLFQTHNYHRIEERLKEKASALKREVENQDNIRSGILDSIELPEGAELDDELLIATEKLAFIVEQKREHDEQLSIAKQQLQNARNQIKEFETLDKLNQEKEKLAIQFNEIEQDRKVVSLAKSAQEFDPVVSLLENQQQDKNNIAQQITTAEQLLDVAKKEYERCSNNNKQILKLKQEVEEKQLNVQKLKEIEPHIKRLSDLDNELNQQRESDTIKNDEKTRLFQAISDIEQSLEKDKQTERPRLTSLLEASEHLTTEYSECRSQLENYKEWQSIKQAASLSQTELDTIEQRGKELKQTHHELATKFKQTQLAWHQGQAAELSKELTLDQPCPVCGSLEHPSPASNEKTTPSKDELDSAQQKAEQANQHLTKERQAFASLKQKLEQQQEQANQLKSKLGQTAEQSLSEVEQHLQSIQTKIDEAEAVKAELKQLEQRILENETILVDKRKRGDAITQELNQLELDKSTKVAERDALQKQVPTEFSELSSLSQKIESESVDIQHKLDEIELTEKEYQNASEQLSAKEATNKAHKEQLSKVEQNLTQTQQQLDQQLSSSVFDDQAQMQSARKTIEVITSLNQSIEQYDAQCQSNSTLLTQISKQLGSTKRPEVTKFESLQDDAQQQYTQTETKWQETKSRFDQLTHTKDLLSDADERSKVLEKDFSIIGTLSAVANGQLSGNRISFQRFVLTVILDDVLLAAGERLRLMSKGRYQLLRTQEKAKGKTPSGLDLMVADTYTSKTRPVATLSGGESFIAALSLALGLSDVVQAHAGGIKLDMLFIDEGFGSLDQESLDLAIRTLIDLKSSGRLVGVISHVSELKDQIAKQIQINKSHSGSSTKIISDLH